MQTYADAHDEIFLPNPVPERPVEYVLICMEPSLGRWAKTSDEARAKLRAGFRNFLDALEIQILHFCVRRYLCSADERYYITDLAKGAMLGRHAREEPLDRYDRWYPLLEKELALVCPKATIIAVGKPVAHYLERKGFQAFTQIIHYSSQAGLARKAGILGRESEYEAFRNSLSLADVLATAESVLLSAGVPPAIQASILSRLGKSRLSESHQKLIFNYKTTFESMNRSSP